MNVSCLVKEKVDKMKKIFASIERKDKLQALAEMSPEERIKNFEKQLTHDEAVLLNTEFEKSVYLEKVSSWVRKNADPERMERALNRKQESSIRRYITDRLFPGKRKSEIIPIADMKKMSDEEFMQVVNENFKNKEDALKIREEFKKALKKQQESQKPKMTEAEKRVKSQVSLIQKYLKAETQTNGKLNVPIRDILKMSNTDRLKFLETLVDKEKAKSMNDELMLRVAKMKEELKNAKPKQLTAEQKAKLQRAVVERYIEQKKRTMTRISIPMKDILNMTPEKQLAELKKMMPADEAVIAQEKIQQVSMTSLEEDLRAKVGTFKSVKDFEAYIQKNLSQFSYFKDGAYLSKSETDQIITMASDVSKKKMAFDAQPNDMNARMAYGRAKDDLLSYASEMKAVGKQTPEEIATTVNSMVRAINYGGDIGTTLLQGGGVISRGEHLKGVIQGFKNLKDEQALKDMRAYIISDPLYDLASNNTKERIRFNMYANELAKKFEIGAYKKLPENVRNGLIKKGIHGANEALSYMERYTAAMSLTRLERFKTMYHLSEELGYDMSRGSKELTAIIRQTNTETGSARLSVLGMDFFERNSTAANALMSSARLFATKFKTLASPAEIAASLILHVANKEEVSILGLTKYNRLSQTVIRAKLRSLIGIATFSALTSFILAAKGYKVETDPRSSDFGKGDIDGMMVDTTLGYGSYMTFLTRFMTEETVTNGVTKSLHDLSDEEMKAGKIRAVDSHGAPIGVGNITASFMRNKLSQFPSAVLDWLMKENNIGQKPTVLGELHDKMLPLFITDMETIMTNGKGNIIEKMLVSVAAFAGSGTYTKTGSQWEDKTTNEMVNFRARVGEDNFKKANKDYNNAVLDNIRSIADTPKYNSLSDKDKAQVISNIKETEKQKIFRQYPLSQYPVTSKRDNKFKSNTAVVNELSK